MKSWEILKLLKRKSGSFFDLPPSRFLSGLSDYIKEGLYISTKQKRQIELLKIMIFNL